MKTTCPPRRTLWPDISGGERRRGQVYPRLEHKNSDTPDEAVHSVQDLAFPVTSDVTEIKAFLNRLNKKVIFSTYQSSPLIAQAQEDPSTPHFDLAIADEAHRCAGNVSGDFSTILDEEKIRAVKRLFSTATPRTYSPNVKKAAEDRGVEVIGMDDETVFGKPLFTLNFGEAIKRGLLTDYRVLIIGVDDPSISAWIENRELLKADSDIEMDAESLAAQVGLLKAIKDYDLRRMISFHSRVSRAEEFSKDIRKVIDWIEEKHKPSGEFKSDFVSGAMPTDERRKKLAQLKGLQDNQRGLLTNARCLSEGVDVPSLDGVAFIDPRSSQIDIIQAVGRAIRLSTNKKAGTIVLPVFIGKTDDPERTLNEGNYKPIWDVLNALKAHDDVLADELNQIRTELGRKVGSKVDPDAFSKITIDLPLGIDKSFGEGFRALLVENATASWDFYFGLLLNYYSSHGNCHVPRGFKVNEKFNLDKWVQHQRSAINSGSLSRDRLHRLLSIGFDPNPLDSRWEAKFFQLKKYHEENGTSNIGSRDPKCELARWAVKQRVKYRDGRLTAHQIERLNTIQFEFERKHFDKKNKTYLNYQEASNIVRKYNFQTAQEYQSWARGNQSTYGVFPVDLPRSPQQVYQGSGWISWALFLGSMDRDQQIDVAWSLMFDQYKDYISQFEQHPFHIKTRDKKLKNWVNTQRQRFRDNLLQEKRIEKLRKIGFKFSSKDNQEPNSEA